MSHQRKSKSSKPSKQSAKKDISNFDDPKFSKRVIVDNSKQYLSSSDSEDAPDYDYLMKLPSGSHFMLKSEQEKYDDTKDDDHVKGKTQFSKYFNIDIKLLNAAINSIPFNERHELNIDWTPNELQEMEITATENGEKYRDLIKKSIVDNETKTSIKISDKIASLEISQASKTKKVQPPVAASSDKESIQQWLDDILDI